MSYKLEFHPAALKEWNKLDQSIKGQFKKKLSERLHQARVPSAAVSGGNDLYKIKLAALGYRLVYKVVDDTVTVYVLFVGKRQANAAYQKGHARDT
jgi:mRNA interferase RelE/StbE